MSPAVGSAQVLILLIHSLANSILLSGLFSRKVFEESEEQTLHKQCLRTELEGKHEWKGHPSFKVEKGSQVFCAILTRADYACFGILALLEVYCTFLHPFLLPKLSFLPLMLTSVISAVIVLWVWVNLWESCHRQACHLKGV